MIVRVLLTLMSILLISWALWFLISRLARRRAISRANGSTGGRQPDQGSGGRWTRQDRLALASLVVGTLLGVLALLKP